MDLYSMFKYQTDISVKGTRPFIADGVAIVKKIKSHRSNYNVPASFINWVDITMGNPPAAKPVAFYGHKEIEKMFTRYFKWKRFLPCHKHFHCRYMPTYVLGNK